MTMTIDDAGIGDLLFGVVIGAFRNETQEFRYEILDVKYFRTQQFRRKEYLEQASRIVSRLLDKLKIKKDEPIHICKGYIFDKAVEDLAKTMYDLELLSEALTTEDILFEQTQGMIGK